MSLLRLGARWGVPLAFAGALAAAAGCHSGGSNNTATTSGPNASFAPDTPTPGNGTIALLPGGQSGASVDVRVTVTGVSNFFGAAFRIKYDPTALLFNASSGMSSATSFLRQGGVTDTNLSFIADSTTTPGEIVIVASRLASVDPNVPVPPVDVTTTSDLVVLNFTARLAIVAATSQGRLDFDDPKEVCDDTANPPNCNAIPIALWSGGGVAAQ